MPETPSQCARHGAPGRGWGAARPGRGIFGWSGLAALLFLLFGLWTAPAAAAVDGPPPAATNHWAFQPLTDPPLPPVRDQAWPQTGIDRFILAKLEAQGLRPAPRAEKRVLLRRATFDLTGLPPTPEELDSFVADSAPDAFARAAQRLLASPRYGERWGRHWLDVARYADSNGMDENLAYGSAWRYRDYVIRAFNADKPYDRFLQEQLAGDLLPRGNDPDPIVATGFLCIGPKMLAEDDPVKMEMDIIDEQLDTTSRAFMGLTVGCGRCHDHKFDPVPMKDYYAMAGIFKSTRTMENFKVVARWQERPLGSPAALADFETHRRRLTETTNRIAALIHQANSNLVREATGRVGDYLLAAQTERERARWLQQAHPIGSTPSALPPAAGSTDPAILIEAENFQRAENVVATKTGYGEGIGVIYGQGGKLNFTEYDVPLRRAGVYLIEVRYAAAASRPVRLLLNRRLANAEVAAQVTGSWNPDTQTWEVAGAFDLPAGTNVLRLERDDCIPHLDKILLANIPASEASRLAAGPEGLVPEWVRQWSALLQKTEADTNSVLAPWHAFSRGDRATPAGSIPLGNSPPPASLAELAARYTGTFRQAADAWRELEKTTAHPERLSDPWLDSIQKLLRDPKGPFALTKDPESSYPKDVTTRLGALRTELERIRAETPALPEAMAVADGTPQDLRVHKRGSHLALGDWAPRGFLQSIGAPSVDPLATNSSGRLQLAQWLSRPDHPLTARVMVNRIWLWHFGEGLVRSPDNFGKLGASPTHPELLDWLACRFVGSGWSIKAMHRLILASAVYEQAVAGAESMATPGDPENRLWSHFNRRRLEAEAIRDALLAVGGNLDLKAGGSVLGTRDREYVTGTASKLEASIYDTPRRSVYLPVIRSALYDVFQVFDFADPSVLNGRRDQTTVAPQALFMLNSPLVARETRRLGRALLSGSDSDAERVLRLYRLAYGRRPTEAEADAALRHVEAWQSQRAQREVQESPDEARLTAWQSLCRAVLAANEFIYLD